MQEELAQRKTDGQELLTEHLGKAEEAAKLFLAALKGFRRDLLLSTQSYPDNIEAEFLENANALAVPPMRTATSFADLSNLLSLADAALDGKIHLTSPKLGPDQETRIKILEEAKIIHSNLMDVADTANRMYQAIQTAGFEFDIFNTKNLEVGEKNVDIPFDRDTIYLLAATSRALGERAVRLDIELVQGMERVETGDKRIKI